MSAPVQVSPDDAFVLLISTVRYSMGRMTYMSSLAPELVVRYEAALTVQQLTQIAAEIESALQVWTGVGKTLGSQQDHEAWTSAATTIRGLATRRAA